MNNKISSMRNAEYKAKLHGYGIKSETTFQAIHITFLIYDASHSANAAGDYICLSLCLIW